MKNYSQSKTENETNFNSHNDTGCAIANAYCALEAVSSMSADVI